MIIASIACLYWLSLIFKQRCRTAGGEQQSKRTQSGSSSQIGHNRGAAVEADAIEEQLKWMQAVRRQITHVANEGEVAERAKRAKRAKLLVMFIILTRQPVPDPARL